MVVMKKIFGSRYIREMVFHHNLCWILVLLQLYCSNAASTSCPHVASASDASIVCNNVLEGESNFALDQERPEYSSVNESLRSEISLEQTREAQRVEHSGQNDQQLSEKMTNEGQQPPIDNWRLRTPFETIVVEDRASVC